MNKKFKSKNTPFNQRIVNFLIENKKKNIFFIIVCLFANYVDGYTSKFNIKY